MSEALMSGTGDPERDEPATHDDERTAAVGVTDRDSDAGEAAASEADATEATDATHATETGPDDTPEEPTAAAAADDLDDLDDDDLDEDERRRPSWALTITLGVVALLAVAALAVTALIVPGWLVKPGSPDETAERAVTALALKDAPGLEAVSCHNQQGQTSNPFPPDALPLVQTVRTAGPARLQLDTQASAPVDIVVSAQGQTQTLSADIVLAVTDGHWCMAGVSQRS